MEISLVIPAYNEEKFIGDCLDSVIKNSHGLLKEILVVDNGSSDATTAIASAKPDVRVIHESRKGTGNARQTGTEEAAGDLVAYIDADTRMPAGWVETVINTFESNPNVVFLSGPYRYYESDRYPLWLLNVLWTLFVPIAYWMTGYVGNGGNCVARKDALIKVGGNDRSIAFFGDDTDLARRLHSVGKTVWKNSFTILTSARRYDEEGLSLYVKYFMNFWWEVFFHRPFTSGSHFIKTQETAQSKGETGHTS